VCCPWGSPGICHPLQKDTQNSLAAPASVKGGVCEVVAFNTRLDSLVIAAQTGESGALLTWR